MSGQSQFALLTTRRFLPLFVVQAIGAFNDNLFRTALTMLYVYVLSKEIVGNPDSIVALMGGLFILPFFLFSAFAGQLADKFDKALVVRRVKLVEIGLVGLASYSLFSNNVTLQLTCVFLQGLQSTMFGPVKYGVLPQYLSKQELLGGNGLIEMGTFLAVLTGGIAGTVIATASFGPQVVSVLMITLALIGYLVSWTMPAAPSSEPDMKLNYNLASETWRVLKQSAQKSDVFLAILGISWFWLLGSVFVTQIIPFARHDLNANENCATLILVVFSVATAAGSVFCNKLLAGKISLKYVPFAAALMSVFIFTLCLGAGAFGGIGNDAALSSPLTMLTTASGLVVLISLFLLAFCSGLFVVPLFALMLARTPYYRRARIVGACNIMNAIFMVFGAVMSAWLLSRGWSSRGLYLLLGITNIGVVIYLFLKLPQTLFAAFARGIMRFLYRVEVKGMEHYEAAGHKVLIVPNHTSFLDGPLLSCFLPERAAFAINTQMSNAWWVKPAFYLYDMVAIDPLNPLSLRSLVNRLKRHQKVVIFPEGRLTVTGGLMKIYEGPAAIANLAEAKVLPLRIDGAIYSPFSRMRGKLRLRWFPKITLTFLPAVKFDNPKDLVGSALREHQSEQLYDVMADMIFKTSNINRTLWQTLLDAAATHGKDRVMLEDIQRRPINYGRVIMGSLILGRKIARDAGGSKHVGVLLPNSQAAVLSMFGLLAHGKVPAMLNFSTGAINMAAGCVAAGVHVIVTSRRFIEAAEMQKDIELVGQGRKIIYLEDVRAQISTADKIYGLWGKYFPKLASPAAEKDPNAPAFILFTSGSEGVPKGVALSHRNLNSNWQQAAARIAFTANDVVFNTLPVFHAFGLLAGVLLPLFSGIRSFQYPSPLHYKIIPELCYDTDATVLFGTDTFLAGYAKSAHPYDFYNMRLIVAGAERLKPDTRNLWLDKFGLRIFEGYGVTECSPALSINTPLHFRNGSVGQMFDGIEYRIEPVPGIEKGGRLFVKGPNIMLGYLRADNPGVIEPPPGGWHDTGDIVDVDAMRYITILGRAKRFAKIAGEMISLTAIEAKLHTAFPDVMQAVVAVPDKKKGEQLVLFTTLARVDRKMIGDALRREGANELMVPKTVLQVDNLPLLGSGKTDYVSLNRMALDKVEA